MRKATAVWLADAQEDLDAASILFDHHKYRGACLHSQQSVEKGLKALFVERGVVIALGRSKELARPTVAHVNIWVGLRNFRPPSGRKSIFAGPTPGLKPLAAGADPPGGGL